MNPLAILEGARQGGRAVVAVGRVFKTRLDRRRTPRVRIEPVDLGVVVVVEATTEIRRKKRRPECYLAGVTHASVVFTRDPSIAQIFPDTEAALRAIDALVELNVVRDR